MSEFDPDTFHPFGPYSLTTLGIKKALIDLGGAMIGIGQNHHKVHDGDFYEFGYTFLAVADGATAMVRFLTGANNFHFGAQVDAEGKAFAKLYRGTTYTGDGTPITPINNNCASSNVPLFTAFHTPTPDVLGAELTPANGLLVPGGTGPVSAGSGIKSGEERVSAVDTDYLLAVTNDAGVAKDITIIVAGYEV